MDIKELFNKKENRLILLEGAQTRVSVTNLMRNISLLTPIIFPLNELLAKVPEYESNFNDLLDKINDNKQLEYLFDSSIFEHIQYMDTNLGDYLLTISNLIEQYQPFKALDVDLIASPMYSDVICYKLTNQLATKLMEKFHVDLQTNNLDAINCLTETFIKMCKLRYYTPERYKKQFNLDLALTDPDFIDNYSEYIENIAFKTIPRLLVQQYVIIEPIGIEEVIQAIRTKVPEVASLLEIEDITPEMVVQLIEKIKIKTQEIYKTLAEKSKEESEDFRLRVTDLFTNDINAFTNKNSIQTDLGNKGRMLFNTTQLPEVMYHSLLFASQELYLDNSLDDCRESDIFAYIETLLQEISSDIQDENSDLFTLNDMFIYKYLSAFHLVFNADFSVISSMMNQQLQMAYQNTLNILNGISPEEAQKAAQERIKAMQSQAEGIDGGR